jgi:hypothetical protein
LPGIIEELRDLKLVWMSLWNSTNKPFGFEIIDQRLGGLTARLETAQIRMQQFAEHIIDDIPELSTPKLIYTADEKGRLLGSYVWSEIVSACKTY